MMPSQLASFMAGARAFEKKTAGQTALMTLAYFVILGVIALFLR